VTTKKTAKDVEKSEAIQLIPLDRIMPDPANRRVGGFDQAKLEQLAESIKAVGVQQPAVVRRIPAGDPRQNSGADYELVAGERRWRSSRLAGMDYLPCIVRDLDDAATLRIQIIENLQREDLHPLDEADGYARLIEEGQYDVEHVAAELGRSPSYVYQRLKLRDLIPAARELLAGGLISAGHGILIARLPEEQQGAVLREIRSLGAGVREAPSVRELDAWIHKEILMELSQATWKLDDEALVPAVGSCKACPKRALYHPELFADVGKKDRCTDPNCFKSKVAAIVERRKAELKMTEHLEVIEGYVGYKEEPKGALHRYDWTECKKKDSGAVPVLVVAGDQPGRLTWGKKRDDSRYEKSEGVKEQEKAERNKQKARTETNRAIFDQVLEHATSDIAKKKRLSVDLLRMIVMSIWDRTWDDAKKAIAKYHNWPKSETRGTVSDQGVDKIKDLDEFGLLRFILVLTFASSLTNVSLYNTRPIPKELRAGADLFEIPVAAIRAAAYAKHGVEVEKEARYGTCRVCGCTDEDCEQCIDKTGEPCTWVDETHTLCSACLSDSNEDDEE
jgi:ParB/RepB/Spo0J family partition protein